MQYRYLGGSGLKVSCLSLGAWVTFSDQIDEATAAACMKEAYKVGVNFFDNAEIYAKGQAEIMMGNIIRKAGWTRSDLVLSTKIFWGGDGPNDKGLSMKHIIEGTDKALKRLQTDYVDLIFCHRPDPDTPILETVRAMTHIINQGKAFYWGTSEWSADQITAAYHIARRERLIPPAMEQPQYNMFTRERVEKEYLSLYAEFGLGTTIWSPLASGLLTGKYNQGLPGGTRASLKGYKWLRSRFVGPEAEVQLEKVGRISSIAEELEVSMPVLGLAWCLKNPYVSSVITGASKPEQVRENMKALKAAPLLTEDIMARIEEILGNRPQPDPVFR